LNHSQAKLNSTAKRTWAKPAVVSKSNMNAAENGVAKEVIDYQTIQNGIVSFGTS
jgi:hypothetical protein